jgi:hypothetical protein
MNDEHIGKMVASDWKNTDGSRELMIGIVVACDFNRLGLLKYAIEWYQLGYPPSLTDGYPAASVKKFIRRYHKLKPKICK